MPAVILTFRLPEPPVPPVFQKVCIAPDCHSAGRPQALERFAPLQKGSAIRRSFCLTCDALRELAIAATERLRRDALREQEGDVGEPDPDDDEEPTKQGGQAWNSRLQHDQRSALEAARFSNEVMALFRSGVPLRQAWHEANEPFQYQAEDPPVDLYSTAESRARYAVAERPVLFWEDPADVGAPKAPREVLTAAPPVVRRLRVVPSGPATPMVAPRATKPRDRLDSRRDGKQHGGAAVACRAHNPEVAGSTPAPATSPVAKEAQAKNETREGSPPQQGAEPRRDTAAALHQADGATRQDGNERGQQDTPVSSGVALPIRAQLVAWLQRVGGATRIQIRDSDIVQNLDALDTHLNRLRMQGRIVRGADRVWRATEITMAEKHGYAEQIRALLADGTPRTVMEVAKALAIKNVACGSAMRQQHKFGRMKRDDQGRYSLVVSKPVDLERAIEWDRTRKQRGIVRLKTAGPDAPIVVRADGSIECSTVDLAIELARKLART